MNPIQEHNAEPVPGLPQILPKGEHILWQGQPAFRSLAAGTFHVQILLVYFAGLIALRIGLQVADGIAFSETLSNALGLAMLGGVAVAVLLLYASRLANASMYTITNRRIVIRTGVAISVTINLPYKVIEAADLRLRKDGSGEIALSTQRDSRASYVLLWPLVKPFGWMNVRPVLRGVPDAETVAGVLATALADFALEDEVSEPSPAPKPAAVKLTPKERLRAVRLHWPLAAAASLIVISVVGVSLVQMSDARLDRGASELVTASIELRFVDREDGGVDVYKASTGKLIETLQPTTNGFLRGALRSLVRERRASDIGDDVPFAVRRTESGRIILYDPATDRLIDLRAFGSTNAGAFARFLAHADDETVVGDVAEPQPGVAAVALTQQETRQ